MYYTNIKHLLVKSFSIGCDQQFHNLVANSVE